LLKTIFNQATALFGQSAPEQPACLDAPMTGGRIHQYTECSNMLYDFAARYAAAMTSGQVAQFAALQPAAPPPPPPPANPYDPSGYYGY
jgi:hypothetical protein